MSLLAGLLGCVPSRVRRQQQHTIERTSMLEVQ